MIAAALAALAATTGATLSAYSSTSGNAGSTFATAATYSTCPNTTITPTYLTGWESGRKGAHADVFVGFGSAAGSTVQSTVVRSGAYALKSSPAGAAAYMGWFSQALPASTTVRFALRFETLPTANVQELFAARATGSAILRYVAASQTLTFALAGTATVTSASSVALVEDQWYVIDLKYDPSAATQQLAWSLDGVAQPSVSTAGTVSGISEFQFGTKVADTYNAYFDDVMLTSSASHYPLGDGRVYALAPDGMGDLTAAGTSFVNDDGFALNASSWQRLDESPLSTFTDYIAQTVQNTNYAEITFANTTETCIRAAAGYITFHTLTSRVSNAKFLVYDGTTPSTIRDGTFTHTTGRDTAKPITPATTWSQSALNGLTGRFGFWSGGQSNSPSPLLDGALIEYEVPQ
ncbi:MAG TPA: hypothetical protein VGW10_06030 [Solirubrobacteraceae bacterium]|nr:hypothetical protein [Solirubrobacteraceae bacterium]